MSKHQRSARFIATLAGGVSAFALGYIQPAVAQQTSQADQPAAAGGAGLEEIVVTARRKEEKAQTVPITLTTYTQEKLTDAVVYNSFDFQLQTPGWVVSNGTAVVQHQYIRGIQGTASYFNGMPEFSPSSIDMYFDVANLQMLKGPQGTLFGIATNGGALVVEPNKPTNDFGGYLEGTVGNYNRTTEMGAVNIPVVEDKVRLRLAGEKSHTDGYVYDIARGVDLGDQNFWIGRGILTVNPTDNFQNEILVGYYDVNQISGSPATKVLAVEPGGPAALAYGPTLQGQFSVMQQLGWYAVAGDDNNNGLYFVVNQWNVIDNATYDVNDNMTIKNILSYEQVFQASQSPGEPLGTLPLSAVRNILPNGTVLPYIAPGPTVAYPDELQVLGKALDDKLGYTIGTFNEFTRTAAPHPGFQCNSVTRGVVGCASPQESSGRTDAVYGQGTYDLGALVDGLSFTGGYRYSWDKVYAFSQAYTSAGAIVPAATGAQLAYFQKPNYTVSLDYQLNPQTLFYVSNTKGYSKGGLNGLSVPLQFQSYSPESLHETEIGFKTDNDIFGMKTRSNMAFYYGDYLGIQATEVTVFNGTTIQSTENAATGYSEGIDGEFTIIPDDAWEFYTNFTYNHTAFLSYPTIDTTRTPAVPVNLAYERPQGTPAFTFIVRGTYHPPIAWIAPGQEMGDLSITASYWWTSITSHIQGIENIPGNPVTALASGQWFPDFYNMDINVKWKDIFGRTGLDATYFITNVTENHWTMGGNSAYSSLGWDVDTPAAPRMMGVTLRYNFGG